MCVDGRLPWDKDPHHNEVLAKTQLFGRSHQLLQNKFFDPSMIFESSVGSSYSILHFSPSSSSNILLQRILIRIVNDHFYLPFKIRNDKLKNGYYRPFKGLLKGF